MPPFLRNTGRGWVTAEYGMLPRSTHTRTDREAARGRQIGPHPGDPAPDRPQPARGDRSRRARRAPDPDRLRRAAGRWRHPHRRDHRQLCRALPGARETGAGGLLPSAAAHRQRRRDLLRHLRRHGRCSISITPRIRQAMTDANFVLTGSGGIVEIQATAERSAVRRDPVCRDAEAGPPRHRRADPPSARRARPRLRDGARVSVPASGW